MKIAYINASASIFYGFYDSPYYNSDMLYYYGEHPEGYSFEFKNDGGWEHYTRDVCTWWVAHLRDALDAFGEGNPLGMKVGKFVKLHSPREYNFTTDKIEVEIEVNMHHLKKWCMVTMHDDFDEYLRETWSSRDGFISFIPNNVRAFKRKYDRGDDRDMLRQIMVEFYLLHEVDMDIMNENVMDSAACALDNYIALEDEEGTQYAYIWNEKDMYVPAEWDKDKKMYIPLEPYRD